jgi:predicted negative regulator of RcsB-dependent stress response
LDEYLSEKEQVERLRAFWRDNGGYLVGGVVLGALLLLGWNRYNVYQQREAEAAAALYQSLHAAVDKGSATDARALLEQLRTDHAASPYTDQAALMLARLEVVSDPDVAVEELRRVMETTKDPELSFVARLRLARVLTYRGQHQDALALLQVEKPEAFAARFSEVEGDIYTELNDYQAARSAYQRALMSPPGQYLLDRSYVQIKLDDLPPAATPVEPSPEGGS